MAQQRVDGGLSTPGACWVYFGVVNVVLFLLSLKRSQPPDLAEVISICTRLYIPQLPLSVTYLSIASEEFVNQRNHPCLEQLFA